MLATNRNLPLAVKPSALMRPLMNDYTIPPPTIANSTSSTSPSSVHTRRSRACEHCRTLKVRCIPLDDSDPLKPCTRCSKSQRECEFKLGPRKRKRRTDTRVAELEKKLEVLQAALDTTASATDSAAAAAAAGTHNNQALSATAPLTPPTICTTPPSSEYTTKYCAILPSISPRSRISSIDSNLSEDNDGGDGNGHGNDGSDKSSNNGSDKSSNNGSGNGSLNGIDVEAGSRQRQAPAIKIEPFEGDRRAAKAESSSLSNSSSNSSLNSSSNSSSGPHHASRDAPTRRLSAAQRLPAIGPTVTLTAGSQTISSTSSSTSNINTINPSTASPAWPLSTSLAPVQDRDPVSHSSNVHDGRKLSQINQISQVSQISQINQISLDQGVPLFPKLYTHPHSAVKTTTPPPKNDDAFAIKLRVRAIWQKLTAVSDERLSILENNNHMHSRFNSIPGKLSVSNDVITRGILSQAEAQIRLDTYRHILCEKLTVVVLPDNITVNELRISHPYLFLTIMTTSAVALKSDSTFHATSLILLAECYRAVLGQVSVGATASLEILHCVVLLWVWYSGVDLYPSHKLGLLNYTAVTLARHLGIDSGNKPRRSLSYERLLNPNGIADPQSRSCRKLWLLIYVANNSIGGAGGQTTNIPWDNYLDECCRGLEENGTVREIKLAQLARMIHLGQDINASFLNNAEPLEFAAPRTQELVTYFHNRLETLHGKFSHYGDKSLELTYWGLMTALYESSIYVTPATANDRCPFSEYALCPSAPSCPATSRAMAWLTDANSNTLQLISSLSTDEMTTLPYFQLSRLSRGLAMITKLAVLEPTSLSSSSSLSGVTALETRLDDMVSRGSSFASVPLALLFIVRLLIFWQQQQRRRTSQDTGDLLLSPCGSRRLSSSSASSESSPTTTAAVPSLLDILSTVAVTSAADSKINNNNQQQQANFGLQGYSYYNDGSATPNPATTTTMNSESSNLNVTNETILRNLMHGDAFWNDLVLDIECFAGLA